MKEGFPLILLVALLFFSAFCSASETALFSLTWIERRRLLEKHPHRASLVADLLRHPRRALVTVLIGNNVVNTCAAAIATLFALRFFDPEGVSLVVALFTVLLIFLCEVIPKVFAVRNNETVALLTAPLLDGIAILISPLRYVVRILSDWILTILLKGKSERSDLISAHELKVLVKIGEEEGILNQEERRMIQKLFNLGEKPVRSIMTPRTDLVALRLSDPWEKQVETMKNSHFTHFPVYQESLDQVVGVVSTQEAILSNEKDLQKFLKSALYIPELKRVDELLRDFQKSDDRFAVCVDEFGGTAGVVTLEDILEEIFGEFYDEYTKPEPSIRELGMGEYLVDAKIPLSQFNDFFHSGLRSQEAETLSGLILEKMGKVPRKGDVLELPEFHFRIHDTARQRILKVVVRPPQ